MMNRADEVSPRLWVVAVKFVDDIIQKATRELQKDQWKGEPDQKSPSPSLGKEEISPAGLADMTSQHPDKDLDGGLTYLPQLNAARRAPQCYGSLFMQRKRRRMQHPRPSKQTNIKTRHSLPAAMGLAEEEKVSAVETLTEEQPATKKGKGFGWLKYCSKKKQTEDNPKGDPDQKSLSPTHGKEEISPAGLAVVTSQCPDKELGEGLKHEEWKVPQHVQSADSSFCMHRKHRRVHLQPSEESPIQTSCSLPAAALISAEEENKSRIRTTVLNEETLVLQSLETSPDNIPEEENHNAALRGETVEQEAEGRDQEGGQHTLEDPKGVESLRERDQEGGQQTLEDPEGVESLCERDQEVNVNAIQPVKEQQLVGEKGKGFGWVTRFYKKKQTEDKKMKGRGRCCWCFSI
ncbi:UNVERIFIED_CONTAM: hypothetical protein FKN15_061731 [Acipenser sinensis]